MNDHGTRGRYVNDGCRCSDCTDANRQYHRDINQRRKAARTLADGHLVAADDLPHGRPSTYSNWHCRCRPCSQAYTAYYSQRRR